VCVAESRMLMERTTVSFGGRRFIYQVRVVPRPSHELTALELESTLPLVGLARIWKSDAEPERSHVQPSGPDSLVAVPSTVPSFLNDTEALFDEGPPSMSPHVALNSTTCPLISTPSPRAGEITIIAAFR